MNIFCILDRFYSGGAPSWPPCGVTGGMRGNESFPFVQNASEYVFWAM